MAIRRAKAEDASRIAKVHVDSWRTTYAGIVPEKFLQEMSYEVFEERWSRWLAGEHQPAEVTFYVAELQAGEVVGFACGGPNRSQEYPNYEGELYAAYLLKEYQRRGFGSLLLSAVVEELAAAGQNSMLAWVLAQNPSRPFYEAVGGKLLGIREIEIGGAVLEEVAYGWDSSRALGALLR